jgi:hypothetical protein
MLRTQWTPQAIDDVLAGTFPASDPPAWTPGMARPAPEIARRRSDTSTAYDERDHVRSPGAIDEPQRSDAGRMLLQAVWTLLGAAGIALLFPLAILAVGTPVALVIRGLLEAARWLML